MEHEALKAMNSADRSRFIRRAVRPAGRLACAGFVTVALAGAAMAVPTAPVPFEPPAGAREVKEGRLGAGVQLGLDSNMLLVPQIDANPRWLSVSPVSVDNEFNSRTISTREEWEKRRAELKKRMLVYFGEMPSTNAPLDVKIEKTEEREEYTFRHVTVVFNEEYRGDIGLLIPKGVPKPAPAVIMYDRWGGGIERATSGVYSRAEGVHLARNGLIVAILNHWDDRFGKSRKLCTAGAATHMVLRATQYLQTLTGVVDPEQIGYWGHMYGADLIPFVGGCADGVSAFVGSCTCHAVTAPYMTDFWSPPFWASQGDNLGIATATDPKMFYSARGASTHPLPFLTQEIFSLLAPRPLLLVNASGNPGLAECIRPVWTLYGRAWAVETIKHKWNTNEPVNARDYTVDFFLRTLRGLKPGKAPPAVVEEILRGLHSNESDERLRAVWLAAWWKCREATPALVLLVTHADPALRRAAAKALQRIGAMNEMLPHLHNADPIVRLAVVETMQMYGTEAAFKAVEADRLDDDKWVNEAKWQTLQVNPWE